MDRARLHREGCVASRELRLTSLRILQPLNAADPAAAELGRSGGARRVGSTEDASVLSDRRAQKDSPGEVTGVGIRPAKDVRKLSNPVAPI